MNTVSLAISVIGGIFGVAGVLGAAIGILKANQQRSTVTTLKENNDALDDRVKILDDELNRTKVELDYERNECRDKLAQQQDRINAQDGQIMHLTELVTKAAAVAQLQDTVIQLNSAMTALGDRLTQHDQSVNTIWHSVDDRLTDLQQRLPNAS